MCWGEGGKFMRLQGITLWYQLSLPVGRWHVRSGSPQLGHRSRASDVLLLHDCHLTRSYHVAVCCNQQWVLLFCSWPLWPPWQPWHCGSGRILPHGNSSTRFPVHQHGPLSVTLSNFGQQAQVRSHSQIVMMAFACVVEGPFLYWSHKCSGFK